MFFRWCAAVASTKPKLLFTSITATFHSAPRWGNSLPPRWRSVPGQSLGPEDPSLQIGASLASALGRRLDLSRERLRLLAPVGAAAGLAAAFNAPISAVLFVIEEVIGRWSAGILGSVVLSAVSSVVVVRWFLGAEPLFRIPAVGLVRPAELLAYATLGHRRRICRGGLCQSHRIFPAAPARLAALDAIFPTRAAPLW